MRTQVRLLLIGIVLPRLAQAQANSWTNINAGQWEIARNRLSGTNLTTGITNTIAEIIIGPGFSGTTTNYLDIGGATNVPARFYRIKGFID